MTVRAGQLKNRVRVERRTPGTDGAGQAPDTWELVGELWASIANETGMGAIRGSLQGGVPTSIARYSFMARFETVRALGIDPAMRIVHDGFAFEIKGITRDLQSRDKAYILCEQGGAVG